MTDIGERGVCGGLLERIRSKLDLVLGCFFLASERIMDYSSTAMIPPIPPDQTTSSWFGLAKAGGKG